MPELMQLHSQSLSYWLCEGISSLPAEELPSAGQKLPPQLPSLNINLCGQSKAHLSGQASIVLPIA